MKKVLVILLFLMLVIVGCKQAVEEPAAPEPKEPVVAQPAPQVPEPVEEPEPVIAVGGDKLQLSEPRCHDNSISLVLTNPSNSSVTIGKDAKIFFNGMLTAHPVCDKLEFGPGESVFCEDITGPLSIRQGKENKIHFNTKEGTVEILVNCEVIG